MSLTFDQLRAANMERVGQFKNKHGNLAHTKPDGSDWSPAQWFKALVGELGELAVAECEYQIHGTSSFAEPVRKEIADVQTYLDLFAARCLDRGPGLATRHAVDDSWAITGLVAALGTYANESKKFDRGDINLTDLEVARCQLIGELHFWIRVISNVDLSAGAYLMTEIGTGVDLGEATRNKFNEVSERVGCAVRL